MRPRCKTSDTRSRAGTLVELVVALAALAIIVLGHSVTGYNAKLDILTSVRQSAAATTALLLSESWAAADGVTTYDAVADLVSQLAITPSTGPSAPAGFTSRGSYAIVIDGVSYRATLSSQELASRLRALNVAIAWSGRYGSGTLDKNFSLTTYVLLN